LDMEFNPSNAKPFTSLKTKKSSTTSTSSMTKL
jgi:hypothetical protein